MKRYLLEKISAINYRIATHEGIAMARLSGEAHQIFMLPTSYIPDKYQNEFNKLHEKIKETIKGIEGRTPSRIKGINGNKKAIQYIKLLINIEDQLTHDK
jgi:hypothetical protein